MIFLVNGELCITLEHTWKGQGKKQQNVFHSHSLFHLNQSSAMTHSEVLAPDCHSAGLKGVLIANPIPPYYTYGSLIRCIWVSGVHAIQTWEAASVPPPPASFEFLCNFCLIVSVVSWEFRTIDGVIATHTVTSSSGVAANMKTVALVFTLNSVSMYQCLFWN